ncbi:hypothetical protein V8E55_009620 [Tylopilus felleus]
MAIRRKSFTTSEVAIFSHLVPNPSTVICQYGELIGVPLFFLYPHPSMSQTVVHTLGDGGPFFILCVYLHRLTWLLFKPSGNLSHNLTGGLLCPVDYDWSDTYVHPYETTILISESLHLAGRDSSIKTSDLFIKDRRSDIRREGSDSLQGTECPFSESRRGTTWDENFNYETFYNNIVDYFEVPGSPGKAAKIKIPALVEQRPFLWRVPASNCSMLPVA